MLHEGYLAEIELDEEAGLLRGIVVNACYQTFKFEGTTIEELRNAFAEAVNTYRNQFQQEGQENNKLCRPISSARHQQMLQSARLIGRSRLPGAPDYMTLQEVFDEWLGGLWVAFQQYRNAGDDGRGGARLACQKTAQFIAHRWEKPELAAPFMAIDRAIFDIQENRYPEIFTLNKEPRARSRSQLGHFSKMFVAALLEVAVRLKISPVKESAARIARAAAKWPEFETSKLTANTVVNWRKTERAKGPADRKPFDDVVNDVLARSDPQTHFRKLLRDGPPGTPKPPPLKS